MTNVVWNTTVKELGNIIKHCGYAATTKGHKKFFENINFELRPSSQFSIAFCLDGYRGAMWKMYAHMDEEIEFSILLSELKAAYDALRKTRQKNVVVEIGVDEIALKNDKVSVVCQRVEKEVDSHILHMDDDDFAGRIIMTSGELQQIGGKERVSMNRIAYLQGMKNYSDTKEWDSIDWNVENYGQHTKKLFISGDLVGKKTERPFGSESRVADMYTPINLNYAYLMQALKCLTKREEVFLDFPKRDIKPVWISCIKDEGIYEAMILPIAPYWKEIVKKTA